MEKPGRNDPCICGSGKKFKKCCESKYQHKQIHAEQITESAPGMNKIGSLFQKRVASHPINEPNPPKPHKDEDFNPVM